MSTDDEDVLAVALIQIAAHAERITDLDTRQASQHHDTATRLDAITAILGRHATVVDTLSGLDQQVAAIADRLGQLTADNDGDSASYQPAPQPRWWHMPEAERESAAGRLRSWVDQVYRPGYGHLAAALPACWELHPLCLYTLDWLSELWSALYLSPERAVSTLGGQAEWQTRLLPAAASQMARETARCDHRNRGLGPRPASGQTGEGKGPGPGDHRGTGQQ